MKKLLFILSLFCLFAASAQLPPRYKVLIQQSAEGYAQKSAAFDSSIGMPRVNNKPDTTIKYRGRKGDAILVADTTNGKLYWYNPHTNAIEDVGGTSNYYNQGLGTFTDTVRIKSDGSLLDFVFYTPGKVTTSIRVGKNAQGIVNGSGFLPESGSVGDSTHVNYSVSPFDSVIFIFSGIVKDTNVLQAPDAMATPLSTHEIAIAFNNILHNNGYQIDWRYHDGGSYTSLVTLLPDDTSFVHSGIPPDMQIDYRVRTLGDTTYYGSNFTFTSATTAALVATATPSITATANSISQITVTIGTVAHADAYELRSGTDSLNFDTYDTLLTTTKVLTSLTSNTTLYFQARALSYDSAYANSAYSSIVSATTFMITQLATPIITVDSVNAYNIYFHWTSSANTVKYLFQASSTDTTYKFIATISPDTLNYILPSLSPATKYFLQMQAIADSTKTSSNIDKDSAITSAEVTTVSQLATPSPLVATVRSASRIDATCANVANETGYRWDISTDKIGWTTVGTTGVNVVSFSYTSLQPSTKYYLRALATADEVTFTKSKLTGTNATTNDSISIALPITMSGALVNTGNTNNNYTGLNNLGLHLARTSYFETQGVINFDNYAKHGFQTFWTYNSDVPGAHSTLPTDTAHFICTLDSLLTEHKADGATDSIYAGAEINEINNLTYWVSTPENILNLVRGCTQVFHEHGKLAYDGGLPCGNPTLYLVWEDFKNRYKAGTCPACNDSADVYAAGAFPPGTNLTNWRTSSNYGYKITYNEALIKGLANIPTDGINIHWYEALLNSDATKTATNPDIFIETAQYLMRTAHKTSVITNEYGLNNNNTISLMQQQVQAVKKMHMKIAVWYSGGSSSINGYGSLVGPTGAVTSMGSAYKIEIAK